MVTEKKPAGPSESQSVDDPPKFLAVLPEEDIKGLKLHALHKGKRVTASLVLEQAVDEWIKQNRGLDPRPLEETAEAKATKRQFLARMNADLIRDLKVMALDWNVTASALVRAAVAEFLAKTKSGDGR